MNAVLVSALASCAEKPLQSGARDFLMGLSSDELQFIADFLGASILESDQQRCRSRAQLAERIAEFQQLRAGRYTPPSPDEDHKMILLLEFLCRSGLQHAPAPMRAWHA